MMRNILASIAAIGAVAIMATGCAFGPASYGPGGAPPAFVYANSQTFPADNTSGTVYKLTTDDFEIRGTVTAEGKSTNILGILSEGNNGYEALLAEARSQGADDVMNVRVDVSYTNILFIYQKVNTRLSGQAVRWTR